MWECIVGGEPLLRLVRGVDVPDPEGEPEQQSQLFGSVRIPDAILLMFQVIRE